jgi:hypothetical protein
MLFAQALAIAGQVTQLAPRLVGDQAALTQAVLHEGGNPLGILHVRLATRHALDGLGIDQEDFKTAFQDVVDGLPVNASAFHPHLAVGQVSPRA